MPWMRSPSFHSVAFTIHYSRVILSFVVRWRRIFETCEIKEESVVILSVTNLLYDSDMTVVEQLILWNLENISFWRSQPGFRIFKLSWKTHCVCERNSITSFARRHNKSVEMSTQGILKSLGLLSVCIILGSVHCCCWLFNVTADGCQKRLGCYIYIKKTNKRTLFSWIFVTF
jgi:hypothetical protein